MYQFDTGIHMFQARDTRQWKTAAHRRVIFNPQNLLEKWPLLRSYRLFVTRVRDDKTGVRKGIKKLYTDNIEPR